MSETILAVLYVIFAEMFAWIAALILAFFTGFYIISLIVDALSPAELKPPDSPV